MARRTIRTGWEWFNDAESLVRVALDVVVGPQAFLAGFPLAGSDPGRGQ